MAEIWGALPVPAAARRLDAQTLSGSERTTRFRFQLEAVEEVAARLSWPAPGSPRRRPPAALGDQRVAQRRERLQLARDAVATGIRAAAARAAA